jgi:two-component system, OmpR family, sensor histidine kinase PfeS
MVWVTGLIKSLFWKLALPLGSITLCLFWLIVNTLDSAEKHISHLSPAAIEQLYQYRDQAQALYQQGPEVLQSWSDKVAEREQVWLTVASIEISALDEAGMQALFEDGYIIGRSINWPIHLYHNYKPVMQLPFVDEQGQQKDRALLIQLPDRLRPGGHWPYLKLILQALLPLLVILGLCWLLYRHLMTPIKQLKKVTDRFRQGELEARARLPAGRSSDELTELTDNFNRMAQTIAYQITSQRQFIADLSHELRTPLTRLELAAEAAAVSACGSQLIQRVSKDTAVIRQLVENTLTLAWLDNETPQLTTSEQYDLVELLDVIIEDARFERPDITLLAELPPSLVIRQGNPTLTGQAIENILRNALKYTQGQKRVWLSLDVRGQQACIRIADEGPGVPEQDLPRLFTPFFRVKGQHNEGFGLGLALARRQMEALSGHIDAENAPAGGLVVTLRLPCRQKM